MHESIRSYVEELLHAARCGFDGVAVSEHSQSSYDISPEPEPGRRDPRPHDGGRGPRHGDQRARRSLGKAREPLQVAEEYALLDTLSGGRLIAGIPIGLSYDANQNGGIPPIETRVRATARDGRCSRRPGRRPSRSPGTGSTRAIRSSTSGRGRCSSRTRRSGCPGGGTPSTLGEVLDREDVFTYLSWFGPTLTGRRIFDRFWDIADREGARPQSLPRWPSCRWSASPTPTRRRSGSTASTCRRTSATRSARSRRRPSLCPATSTYAASRRSSAIPATSGIAPKLRTITFRELADTRAAIVGSPETVREQITEFVKEFRIGNLLVMLHVGSMPHELARHNISLFASDVLPHLRGIWDDEGWEHRWWPTGIGTPDAAATR